MSRTRQTILALPFGTLPIDTSGHLGSGSSQK
ncbi:hypothetical protein JOD53_001838 [Brevibacterium luteolum]|nr:hypothetical protein [Brevibacterium luteolum]